MTQAEQPLSNWGGNYYYQAEKVVYPESVEQVQDIVRNSDQVKGLGSRHSFNSIADTTGTLVSFEKLNRIVELDEEKQTVTVEPGVTYGQLSPYLDGHGFALPNLASLPHITVVGSCMTGTHGSGVNNGNLATSVIGIEFISADGELHTVTQDDDDFSGMVVGLGAYGLVTKMTLKLIPGFQMWQQLFLKLPHSTLFENYEKIVSSAYSVSLFTSWQHDYIDQVWLKARADQSTFETFFDAEMATTQMHPIEGGDIQAATEQRGHVGSWYERLPHFRMGFQPSFGREIQSEFFVDIQYAVEAIKAVNSLKANIAPNLFITELRAVAADDLWMSPCYQRTSIGIHFTWKPDMKAVLEVLPAIEAQLKPFDARPHWGKVYTMPVDDVWSKYERFADFRAMVRKYDPDGKFNNAYLGDSL